MNTPLRPTMHSPNPTNANQQSTQCMDGIFPKDSIGQFLSAGVWPEQASVSVNGVVIKVVGSHLCLKWQKQPSSPHPIGKIRIGLDLVFEVDDQAHDFHLEDLFSISTMEVLKEHYSQDEAMGRVIDAIKEAIVQMPIPIEMAMGNCLMPMRLYEPILDALLPPTKDDSMANFLQRTLPALLLNEGVPFVTFEDDEHIINITFVECQNRHSFRNPNAIKLICTISWAQKHSDNADGLWKSKGILLADAHHLSHEPAPNQATHQQALNQWRQMLRAQIQHHIANGFAPLRIKQLLEHAPLEEAILATC